MCTTKFRLAAFGFATHIHGKVLASLACQSRGGRSQLPLVHAYVSRGLNYAIDGHVQEPVQLQGIQYTLLHGHVTRGPEGPEGQVPVQQRYCIPKNRNASLK